MNNLAYREGYKEGQLGLLNAMIHNAEQDMDFLIDELSTIKKYGGSKAKHVQEGKIEAIELHKQRLEEAYKRLSSSHPVHVQNG